MPKNVDKAPAFLICSARSGHPREAEGNNVAAASSACDGVAVVGQNDQAQFSEGP